MKVQYGLHKIVNNNRGMFIDGIKVEPTKELIEEYHKHRFWNKVAIKAEENLCWEWLSCKIKGYGVFELDGKGEYSHRIAYMYHLGVLPERLMVCHSCDNPSCCNPKHLFLGTGKDNQQDCIAKGRKWRLDGERCGTSKLSEKSVLEIRQLRKNGIKLKEISEQYGVAISQISSICSKRHWKHI